MCRLNKVLFFLLLLALPVFAQDETDYIIDSSKESTIILNDNLRKTTRRLRNLENTFPLPLSSTTGILPVSRGGTGADNSTITQGYILYISATGVISWLAPGTSGYVLKTNGAAANPSWTMTLGEEYSSGSLVETTAATERNTDQISYTKVKQFSAIQRSGIINIQWEYRRSFQGAGLGYSQAYINGSPVGTEHSKSLDSYSTVSSGNVSVTKGDLVQVYAKDTNGAQILYVKNLSILCANPTIPTEVTGY